MMPLKPQNEPRDRKTSPLVWLCWPFLLMAGTMLFLAGQAPSQSLAKQPRRSPQAPPQTSQQPQAPPATSPSPIPELAVPLPEVADRLNNSDRLLRTIRSRLSEDQGFKEIAEESEVTGRNLTERAAQLDASLKEAPTIEELGDMEAEWRQQNKKFQRQLEPLTRRLTELENYIGQLEGERKLWELTRSQYRQVVGTEIIVERIDSTLIEIRETLALAQKERRSSLVVQNLLARQALLASDVLDKIRNAQEMYNNSLLRADKRPLWQIWAVPLTGPSFVEQTRQAITKGLLQTWELLKGGWPSLLFMTLIFLLVSSLSERLGKKMSGIREGSSGHGDTSLLYRPGRVSLIVAAWFLSWLLPLMAPPFLGHLLVSLTSIIFLLLVPPLFPAAFRPLLHLFTGAFALARLWSFFASVPLLERLTSLFALAAITATAAWLMRASRLGRFPDAGRVSRLVIRAIWLALALLLAALVANLLGLFALSKLLSRGVNRSVFSAISLYVLARIAGALFSLLIRTRWARSLASIRLRGDVLYKWVTRLFVSLLVVWWALTTLAGFGVADQVVKGLGSVLSRKISIGALGFTLGDVIAFGIVLLASYALSRTVGFFLQEDVLPRFSLQRGLPNAIVTIVHYCLLLAGFLVAMASVGLDLTRFTVLAGAFGLAIGFGVQNILNNFVSGLILLFERPINVGDIVEVNGLTGQVRYIGIRASTIHTGQGADVIVPNSNLVANQFINWTYLDTVKRIDLKVMVARNTEPERMLKLLSDVARTASRVEKDPAPVALFRGFGESGLSFELQYWVQAKTPPEVESGVALAVAAELRKAGIEVPIPQRDLYLKSVASEMTPEAAEDDAHLRNEETREKQLWK
jgi:potassium-dependent mechanosensitive channel